MSTVKFQLEELTCPSCIKKIEGTLAKQTAVEDVKVLFSSSKVKAIFNEKIATADDLADVIEKLGYQVLSKKVS